ncbi:MAG: anaerobic ribonucleoside-triphosphate reductase, partial [Candidatus Bathyarchaeia archaeon]
MPRKAVKLSSDIFGAVSAPTRIQALKLLNIRGALSYSELMEMLNLEPSKDAGKFVYHLKNLLSSNLIDMDTKKKKYRITDLGSVVVDFAQTLEEHALKKQGKLMVRTSKYVIEEFDRGKITEAMISEATVPPDLAEKISAEAEERLLKLPTRYLTAPLIREFVNAILIEKGHEDYRHKLTRLGMPVHDVAGMFLKAAQQERDTNYVSKTAGDQVLTEFMLLNALPREIADAHLSGKIHICNSTQWVLKPHTVYHDLRAFFKYGLKSGSSSTPVSISPPKSFTSSLFVALDVAQTFQKEISGQQTLDYFNVFLAPFLDNITDEQARELLKIFLTELSLITSHISQPVTLGLEFGVPEQVKNSPAISLGGKTSGTYGDFEYKTEKVLKLLIESALELSETRPLFSPHLLLKLRSHALRADTEEILAKAHTLASRYGVLHIANLAKDWQDICSYNGVGERLESDWTDDWEVDTLRVGFLDNVSLNLPRAA